MRMRVCAHPGCPVLSEHGRCPRHRDQGRQSAAARGYGANWARARQDFLRAFPTCQYFGCGEPAVDVHHVDGLGPTGPRGFDWANLKGLCHAHHSALTIRDQPGGFTARPRARTIP